MMTTQMKQAAFKALFTAESMEAYENKNTKNIFPPARELIKSACEDDEPEHINTAFPPMPFKKLTREFHLTHDVFLEILWRYSIYANDPSITSPEAFNDKMEELTTYRMGAGLQGLDGDLPDINCEDNQAGKYDKIIIHNAILGVFLHSVETLRTGCESCPRCLEEAEKKRELAEKRAMVQRNVAEALRQRAEEEAAANTPPQIPTPPPALEESEEEDIQEMRCEKCSFRIGSHTMEESIACGLIPEEVVVEVSAIPTPVAVGVGGVSPQTAEDEFYLDLEKQLRTETKDIYLDIDEIDDIPVRVVIERSEHSIGNIHLRVYLALDKLYQGDDDTCLYSYYTGGNNDGIDPVVKIIKAHKDVMNCEEFWFDKIHNNFTCGKELIARIAENRRKQLLSQNAFKNKKGRKIQLLGEECPCCNELTKGKTACGHPLCLQCLVKVEERALKLYEDNDEDDEDEYEVPCPMCRQCIIGKWKQVV